MRNMKRIVCLCLCVMLILANAPQVSAEANCFSWGNCVTADYDYVYAGSPFYYKDWQVINTINGNVRIIPMEEVSYTLAGQPIYNGYIFTYKDEGKELTAKWKGRTVSHILRGATLYSGMRYDMVSQPTKLEYKVGEGFDPTGFSAIFKKSSKDYDKEITLSPKEVTFTTIASFIGYDNKKTDKYHYELSEITKFAEPGSYRVVAEYVLPSTNVVLGESFVINVSGSDSSDASDKNKADKATLSIRSLPKKLNYVVGEKFQTKGFSAVYTKNGVTKRLKAKNVKFTSGSVLKEGKALKQAGNKKVVVSYKGVKTSFNLKVKKERTSSKMKPPKKTTYYVGEPFDTKGFSLKYTDSKGTRTVKANNVKFTCGVKIYNGRPFKQAGKKEVTMTYRSTSKKFQLTVLPAK